MVQFLRDLPEPVANLIRATAICEYATVSGAGLPIDTPTLYFPSADLQTLDIGTGLAYPAKAERARRNPKVGLLIEGAADQPVVSVAGLAAVRDSDLQANLERYLAETIFAPNVNPDVVPWEKVRKRLFYLTRVIVCVAPVHVRWWDRRADLDRAPHEWKAPAGSEFPKSDPAPRGKPSPAPAWPQSPWQELAETALSQGMPAHLTLLDGEGYPLPIRVKEVARHDEGFRLAVPEGAPWRQGRATLSFVGKEVFVGDVTRRGDESILRVERALPILPLMHDPSKAPADTLEVLNRRLEQEAERRGQPIPTVPETPPEPTEGATFRAAAARALDMKVPGGRKES